MGKGKRAKIYPIYYNRKNNEGEVIVGTKRTKISFTSPEEAEKYCRYLNRPDVYGDRLCFSYKEEEFVLYKHALDLIKDANEDAILFS